MAGPLGGLLVLEIGDGIPAGFCGRLLAGFGATVVKVEPPGGDPARHARVVPGVAGPDPERAPLFAYLGMGKRSVVATPQDPSVREAAMRADVLIDGRAPGELDAAGLGWSAVSGANPGLVYASLTPFGTTGPYRHWRAENITAFAAGGQMSLTGEPDREPLCTGGEQAWYQLALAGFAGVSIALYARDRTGLGQHVDVCAMEVMAAALEGFGPTARSTGAPTPRSGTHRLSLMGIYPCADGHAGLFAMPRQLPILASLLADPALPDRFRVDSPQELIQRAEELKDILGGFFGSHSREKLRAMAKESRLPMAPVQSVAEVAGSEHLRERGFFAEVHAGGTKVRVPGPPVRIPLTPWESKDPPRLGELSTTELATIRSSAPAPSAPRMREPAAVEGAHAIRLDRPSRGPLHGVRVLDMTQYWLGPYCTKWLADFGADVVKVESPQRMDFVRTIVASREDERWWDRSAYFNNYNRGKRSLAVDPLHDEGRKVLLDLAARCDVVVENFAAGYMQRNGIGYDVLRQARPDLIMLSGTAYGSWGPDSGLAGIGTNMEQLSGLCWLNQYADEGVVQPYNTGVAYGDPTGGTVATAAVLIALMHRDRTGEGQHIDLAAQEVIVSMIGEQIAALSLGLEPAPKGNRHPDVVPHGVHPCEGDDRWVTVAVGDDDQWRRLASLIGRDDLAPLGIEERRAQRYEIDVAITTWTVVRSDRQAAESLQAIGVAAAPVLTPGDLVEDVHLRVRGFYQTVDDPDQGQWPHDGVAWHLSRTPGHVQGPTPRFGQHTREILRDVLGYDEDRIAALYASGAASDAPTR